MVSRVGLGLRSLSAAPFVSLFWELLFMVWNFCIHSGCGGFSISPRRKELERVMTRRSGFDAGGVLVACGSGCCLVLLFLLLLMLLLLLTLNLFIQSS